MIDAKKVIAGSGKSNLQQLVYNTGKSAGAGGGKKSPKKK